MTPSLPSESPPRPELDAPAGIHRPTQLFGAVPSEPAQRKTSLYGASSSAEQPAPSVLLPADESPTGTPKAISEKQPAYLRGPVSLPPELLAASRDSAQGAPDAQPANRATSFVWGLLVVGGILLAGVLAYPAWRDRDANMPTAAVTAKDEAAALLRRDDEVTRATAIDTLKRLTVAHPKYVEARAELLVALSLRLGEHQAEVEGLRLRAEQLQREMGTLAPDSLELVARAEELSEVTRLGGPLKADLTKLRDEVDALAATLEPAPEVEPTPALVARVKARALHAAVRASPDALALAERLRNVESTPKVWSTLARAEYVLSSGSPPTSIEQSKKDLEALREADGTLLRAHVLGARMALRQDDTASARSLLDVVHALNPNHDVARKLLKQLDARGPKP
ncbi:hypothetical protein NVS55_22385 [Myxococcus stipitatus]|uniref:hypothetical protein n=1 Tax=Myxococcus stipitatus TaxID=83455 RepID=UPI003144DAEA